MELARWVLSESSLETIQRFKPKNLHLRAFFRVGKFAVVHCHLSFLRAFAVEADAQTRVAIREPHDRATIRRFRVHFADRFQASLFLLLSGGPIHGGSVPVYKLRAAVRANRQKHGEHGQSQQHQFAQLRREILPRKKRKHAQRQREAS